MTQITLEANHCWIDTTPENLAKDYGNYGIYILGIRSNHPENRILPYYVGLTEASILARIKKHIYDVTKPKTTYGIFSEDFLRNKRGTPNDFIVRDYHPSRFYPKSAYGNDLLYLNSHDFFSTVVGSSVNPSNKKGERPLNLLSNSPNSIALHNQASSAQKSVFCPGSLYFSFITFKNNPYESNIESKKELLKRIEAFVKYSLKINTIGQSNSFETLQKYLKTHQVTLNIKCPDIDQQFHPIGKRPTNIPVFLFP